MKYNVSMYVHMYVYIYAYITKTLPGGVALLKSRPPTYRTEVPGFESRKSVRFKGLCTLRCRCKNLMCIVIVLTWKLNVYCQCAYLKTYCALSLCLPENNKCYKNLTKSGILTISIFFIESGLVSLRATALTGKPLEVKRPLRSIVGGWKKF
jgi:hypothetical protein